MLLHYQSASEPASVRKLLSVLNKSTGEVLKRKPRWVGGWVGDGGGVNKRKPRWVGGGWGGVTYKRTLRTCLKCIQQLLAHYKTMHPYKPLGFGCRCLLKHQTALLEVETVRPVCLETYQTNRNLGRVTLRCGGTTIAAGVVTKVTDTNNNKLKHA